MDTVEVDEHWCLVHATHADADERARMAKAKAVVGLCPITEANLGDGLFDVPDFLAQGGRFGVGSDSNVRISAADELRTLEYGQRLILRQRTVQSTASRHCSIIAGSGTSLTLLKSAATNAALCPVTAGAGYATSRREPRNQAPPCRKMSTGTREAPPGAKMSSTCISLLP